MAEMNALRYLKMKPVEGFLDTYERVGKARKGLEDATRENLEALARAKRNAWHLAKYKVLD